MDFLKTTNDVRASDDIREEIQEYIQSQYSASPTICALLRDFRNAISPTADIQAFIDNYMSLETAWGKGLDALGRIIGIGRTIRATMQDGTEKTFTLADEKYRTLLKYKALANILDTSLETLNRMLNYIFPELGISVVQIVVPAEYDGGVKYNSYPMHVRFYTEQEFDEEDWAIFYVGGTLCLNAGVGWSLVSIEGSVFGFRGSELQPFNQGRFWDGTIYEGT